MEAISLELKIVFPCQLQVHVDKVDFVIMCADVDANVEYVELNVPFDFPLPWRRFLPNVFYSGSLDAMTTNDER